MMDNFENLCLVLIKERKYRNIWIDTWSKSYPISYMIEVDDDQTPSMWQQIIDQKMQLIPKDYDFVFVAHSSGCNAFISWIYKTSIYVQKKIKAAILSAPLLTDFDESEASILNRTRFNFKAAIVVSLHDENCPYVTAKSIADKYGAKCLITPYQGHLDEKLQGWEWGMVLMQDMLLA